MKLAFGNGLRVLLGAVIAVALQGCGDAASSAAGVDAQLTVSLPHASSNRTTLKVAAPEYIKTYTIEVRDAAENVIVPSREISANGGEVSLSVPPNTALRVIGAAFGEGGKEEGTARFRGDKVVPPIAVGAKASVALILEALAPLGTSVQAAGFGTLTVADNTTNVTVIKTNAQEDQHLAFSITGGVDKSFFSIDASSGQLSFLVAPSSANPQDADQNNLYEVQVTFTDGFESAAQDLKVVVGYLDTSFGVKGIVTTDIGIPTPRSSDRAKAVVVQSDDKIVVAGITAGGSALVRYLANGNVDVDNFGTQGIAMLSIPNANVAINAMALQGDRKIVVAGTATAFGGTGDFLVARFDTNGQLDAGFGDPTTPGMVITDVFNVLDSGGNDNANALALQADGKIVVVGKTSDVQGTDWIVARYDSSGTLDTSFGVQNGPELRLGMQDTNIIGSTFTDASAVTLQGDTLQTSGKIVVAGYGDFPTTGNDFVVVRYNSNGTLDSSFDKDGIVTTDFMSNYGNSNRATGVVIQPDGTPEGKIVAIGSMNAGGIHLTRYNIDGKLDVDFGVGGKVTDSIGSYPGSAYAVTLQPDGKIIVAGNDGCGECSYTFALARYKPNGSVDASFGTDGKIITNITNNGNGGPSSTYYALALQPNDGKIIAVGNAYTNTGNDFAVVRYNP